MKRTSLIRKLLPLTLIVFVVSFYSSSFAETDKAKNVILFVGDGMGFGHVQVGEAALGKSLSFRQFPHRNVATIYSANNTGTDSAAAATALATGQKVNDGVVSIALPEHADQTPHQPLETLLEVARKQGKRVGVITNTFVYDATPAGFTAHAADRGQRCDIIRDMFTRTKPDVVMGHFRFQTPLKCIDHLDGHKKSLDVMAQDHGFTVARSADQLRDINDNTAPVLAIFPASDSVPGIFKDATLNYPKGPFTNGPLSIATDQDFEQMGAMRLQEMIQHAIRLLEGNPNGFFLLVENSHPDRLGHFQRFYDRCAGLLIEGLESGCPTEFPTGLPFEPPNPNSPTAAQALAVEMDHLSQQVELITQLTAAEDTLLVVTADHDTNNPTVVDPMSDPIKVEWGSINCRDYGLGSEFSICGHSELNVGVWAWGKNSDMFSPSQIGSPMDNTDIHQLLLRNIR